MSIRKQLDTAPRPGVRTFTPRWRTSALTAERMERLLPAAEVGSGTFDQQRAFGRVAPLVVEIGSGHGAAAVAYAAAHPSHDVLAVEVHVPGVARMLAAAEAAQVSNLRVHRGDALPFLTDSLPSHCASAIHLFFPDPWPKKKHAKRRFVQQHTLDTFARLLAPDGVLRIATDHEVYAEHVREQLAIRDDWQVVDRSRPEWRPTDGFEAKGLRAGRSITDLTLALRR